MSAAKLPLSHAPRKSGSGNRQRQRVRTLRLSAREDAESVANAEAAGLSVSAFIRKRAVSLKETRSRRRPSVELAGLAKLLAQVNRVGGDIQQLLKRLNSGEIPQGDEIREAFASHREMVNVILAVMGTNTARDAR